MDTVIEQLRNLVEAYSLHHSYETAAYYAEKLVVLTTSLYQHNNPNNENNDPSSASSSTAQLKDYAYYQDIYKLAEMYYCNHEYPRALKVLEHYDMLNLQRFRYNPSVLHHPSSINNSNGNATIEPSPSASPTNILPAAAKALFAAAKSTRTTIASTNGGTATVSPPPVPLGNNSHLKNEATNHTTNLTNGKTDGESSLLFQQQQISTLVQNAPSQLYGVIHPLYLKFFYLAALCYIALKAYEKCIILLESCMEGKGHAGLRVPLRPLESTTNNDIELLTLLLKTNNNENVTASSKNSTTTIPSTLSTENGNPNSVLSPNGSGSIAGVDGIVTADADQFYTATNNNNTTVSTDPKLSNNPNPNNKKNNASTNPKFLSVAGNTVTSQTSNSSSLTNTNDGLKVWAILQHMALQHNEISAVFSTATGKQNVYTNPSTGPITIQVSPLILGLNVPAGHTPITNGKSVNLVALMCTLRGKALLALDNRLRAAQWFLAAVRIDPYCIQAFHALVDNYLLTDEEESRLLTYLRSVLGPTVVPLLTLHKLAVPFPGTTDHSSSLESILSPEKKKSRSSRATTIATNPGSSHNRSASASTTGSTASLSSIRSTSSLGTNKLTVSSKDPGTPNRAPLSRTNSSKGTTVTAFGSTVSSPRRTTSNPLPTDATTTKGSTILTRSASKAKMNNATAVTHQSTNLARTPSTRSMTKTSSMRISHPESIQADTMHIDGAVNVDMDDDDSEDEQPSMNNGSNNQENKPHTQSKMRTNESTDPSSPQTLPITSTIQRIDNTWLLHLYSCRLNRYGVTSGRTLNERFRYFTSSNPLPLYQSLDVVAAKAESYFASHDPLSAVTLTRSIMSIDPFHRLAGTVHYAALVSIKATTELFQAAHYAVDIAPRDPLSWYAVGCYYSSLGRYTSAVRHLVKCVQLDNNFAPAWLALGLAYAAQEENEPALAACRTAMRLYPASHIPPLTMATLCSKTGATVLAKQYIDMATARCPHDPAVYHEAGVLEYRNGAYGAAHSLFRFAAAILTDTSHHVRIQFEPTYINLGHAARKLGRYHEAIQAYSEALALIPNKPSTLACLGFAYQLAGDAETAVIRYHAALSKVPDDSFCQRMLRVALQDMLESSIQRQQTMFMASSGVNGNNSTMNTTYLRQGNSNLVSINTPSMNKSNTVGTDNMFLSLQQRLHNGELFPLPPVTTTESNNEYPLISSGMMMVMGDNDMMDAETFQHLSQHDLLNIGRDSIETSISSLAGDTPGTNTSGQLRRAARRRELDEVFGDDDNVDSDMDDEEEEEEDDDEGTAEEGEDDEGGLEQDAALEQGDGNDDDGEGVEDFDGDGDILHSGEIPQDSDMVADDDDDDDADGGQRQGSDRILPASLVRHNSHITHRSHPHHRTPGHSSASSSSSATTTTTTTTIGGFVPASSLLRTPNYTGIVSTITPISNASLTPSSTMTTTPTTHPTHVQSGGQRPSLSPPLTSSPNDFEYAAMLQAQEYEEAQLLAHNNSSLLLASPDGVILDEDELEFDEGDAG